MESGEEELCGKEEILREEGGDERSQEQKNQDQEMI